MGDEATEPQSSPELERGGRAFFWTVIATTDDRFAGFGPYVASVNGAGAVAFQAALPGGGTGVFIADGGEITQVLLPAQVAAVTSHPDLNDGGDATFYGELAGGGQGVFLLRDGHLMTLADTRDGFASIGPAGPTMNDAGSVAFRAARSLGSSGIFSSDGATVSTIADTTGPWSGFHGLPVIDDGGTVVFRADRKDGLEGIYACRHGSIRAVAETGDVFETLGLFPSVGADGTVAFAATLRAGGSGVFSAHDDGITAVQTGGAFESYRGALVSASGVVRIATPRGGSLGLFAGPDPHADRILAVGDPLFGSTVDEFASNPVSAGTTGQVAVRAMLADGRELILRADPTT
jgi:hypothetical protein